MIRISPKLEPALAQTCLGALQVTFQLFGPNLHARFLKKIFVTPRDSMKAKASKRKLFPVLLSANFCVAFAYDDSTVIWVGNIAFHRFGINIQDI